MRRTAGRLSTEAVRTPAMKRSRAPRATCLPSSVTGSMSMPQTGHVPGADAIVQNMGHA